ncbi:hypothetical protein EP331_00450 [bacterium]|nr:MAG: hypothetical protein EP331_00450 [bacterium]
MSKPVIQLRVYKKFEGRNGIFKNELGKIENEVLTPALEYDTLEWHNYLKNLSPEIHAKIEVESYSVKNELGYQKQECPENILNDIQNLFKKPQRDLTPQEKEIAELRAMIAELKGSSKPDKTVEKVESSDDDELDQARAKYKEAFGKKPHHSWDAQQIEEKIKELSE